MTAFKWVLCRFPVLFLSPPSSSHPPPFFLPISKVFSKVKSFHQTSTCGCIKNFLPIFSFPFLCVSPKITFFLKEPVFLAVGYLHPRFFNVRFILTFPTLCFFFHHSKPLSATIIANFFQPFPPLQKPLALLSPFRGSLKFCPCHLFPLLFSFLLVQG